VIENIANGIVTRFGFVSEVASIASFISGFSLSGLLMTFSAKWQNFCVRKTLMPKLV